MDKEDSAFLKAVRNWIFGLVIGLLLIGGAATVVSAAFGLAWFPWEIKMKTRMIRASNSYITTQQSALRHFMMAYNSGSPEQQAAIIQQMHELADTIPGDVQPDIRTFLEGH